MFKNFLYLFLAGLILNLATVSFANTETKSDKAARFAEKVKSGIAKIGTGETALVEVKLRDNTRIKGYVKQIGDDSFIVVDPKTGAETRVDYYDTKQIRGNNLSTGAKIAIGLAILAGVLTILLIFENYG